MPSAETIKEILIRRDSMSEAEATDLILEARDDLYWRLDKGEDIDDAEFMADWFGLEPDYFLELLW